MKQAVESYLIGMREKYKEASYDEIISLGWISEEPINIDGKKYHPCVWGQEFNGQALLVVQLTRWFVLNWLGRTDCFGLLVGRSGSKEYVDAHWLMHEVGHP